MKKIIIIYSYYRKYFINLWLIVIITCMHACGNDGVAVIDDKDMGTLHLLSAEIQSLSFNTTHCNFILY